MESPIFRNRRWYQQPRSASYHPIPASSRGVPVYQERSSGPKVVRIPVHFVGSEQVDRSGSAVKIQKVFRGFLVRKCLKKVKDIGIQVDLIEARFSEREVVELLGREEKERLKMNESLMSLLFKLDSICGVDFGVRGCRKAVIRKVIALQERIDAIVAAADSDDQKLIEIRAPVETEDSNECGHSNEGEAEVVDVGVDCEVKVSECNVVVEKKQQGGNGMLERMMEESEKMTKLMNEMCERNEMQMKMLDALTNRVEMLEKAFVCDRLKNKMKKKNKKKTANITATCKEN